MLIRWYIKLGCEYPNYRELNDQEAWVQIDHHCGGGGGLLFGGFAGLSLGGFAGLPLGGFAGLPLGAGAGSPSGAATTPMKKLKFQTSNMSLSIGCISNYDILTADNADDDNTQCYPFIHFPAFTL